jgi:uncharacterized RDD family membrane protein YckC
MNCSYCGSRNSELEHRCRRCGRRPGDTLNNEFTLHRTTGALATKPSPIVMAERPPLNRPTIAPNLAGAVQGSLFTPNVVAMPARPAQTGRGSATTPRPNARPKTAATAANGIKQPSRRNPRPVPEGQGQLEFLPPVQSKPKTLATTVEAMIYCEAPVATPMHRACAAAIDWAMVLIAYGLFLFTFALCHGEFELNRPNLMIFGGALAVIAVAYGAFWIVMGTESFGMRWTQLRVITFDGYPPETSQRILRFFGSCLSLFSVLGALWSWADEEGLGWQDHMSRTFPTPYGLDSRIFTRQ